MGAVLSAPMPELTRHSKNRMVHRRPKPHCHRVRVPLDKGCKHADWVRLTQSGADLAGLSGQPPRHSITMGEVALHCTADDAWVVLRGRVYNMTPYLRFHPGGAAVLMEVAGKDGTALFDKWHSWVNADALMDKCLVGYIEAASLGSCDGGASMKQPAVQPEEQQHAQHVAATPAAVPIMLQGSTSLCEPGVGRRQQQQQSKGWDASSLSEPLLQQERQGMYQGYKAQRSRWEQLSSLPPPGSQRCGSAMLPKQLGPSIGLHASASAC